MNRLPRLLILLFSLSGGFSFSAPEEKPVKSVEIRVQGVPKEEKARIDGRYAVSPEKTIQLPGLGAISIDGLAAGEIAKKLRHAFIKAEIYTDPIFNVVIDIPVVIHEQPNSITVAGFVQKPGPKAYTPGMTIFQAITEAGGINPFGNIKRVNLVRGKSIETYNLNEAEYQQIELQAGDTIEVLEKCC